MSDSRHGKREFPVHEGPWPAHGRGLGLVSRPEHAPSAEGDGEQAEPKKAAPRVSRSKATKEPAAE